MVIENEINLFIKSEENNGALLITGKWGCGKSYLIKECASDLEVKDHYAIAIISLFGVDTIATLNKKVRNAYLEFASGVFGKKARKKWLLIVRTLLRQLCQDPLPPLPFQ